LNQQSPFCFHHFVLNIAPGTSISVGEISQVHHHHTYSRSPTKVSYNIDCANMTRDKARHQSESATRVVWMKHHWSASIPIFFKSDGMCTLYLSTLLDSWVWMNFKSDSLKSNSRKKWTSILHLLYLTPYGWLAYVLFHAYRLDACEQTYLGKHAHQSSWCLRYGFNDMIFALTV
jgi:hypothetical protein